MERSMFATAMLTVAALTMVACGQTSGEVVPDTTNPAEPSASSSATTEPSSDASGTPDPSPSASESPTSEPSGSPEPREQPVLPLDPTSEPSYDPAANNRPVQVDLTAEYPLSINGWGNDGSGDHRYMIDKGQRLTLFYGSDRLEVSWDTPDHGITSDSPNFNIENHWILAPEVYINNFSQDYNMWRLSEGESMGFPQNRDGSQRFAAQYWWIQRDNDDSCGDYRKCYQIKLGWPGSPTLLEQDPEGIFTNAPMPVDTPLAGSSTAISENPGENSTRNVLVKLTGTIPLRFEMDGSGRGLYPGTIQPGESFSVSSNDQDTQTVCARFAPPDSPLWSGDIRKMPQLCAHNPDLGYPSVRGFSSDFGGGSEYYSVDETKGLYPFNTGYQGLKFEITRNGDDTCGGYLKCFTFNITTDTGEGSERLGRWFVIRN